MKYSVLDLAPIPAGGTAADALETTGQLAERAEALGYTRYWLAEHHNMPGIASSATSVLIGHVASRTKRIRVGSGGIMLPNHAPLVIAEQFGTLATLYGDRIDLGLGRAPGTDMETAQALRRGKEVDRFPRDVMELMAYLDDPEPDTRVRAIPGMGTKVPVYILGSSLYGAQMAAYFGLPYAFASHFAPDALEDAAHAYRSGFRPSATLSLPYFMMAINVFAAETDQEGKFLKTSMQQAFANLRLGRPGPLPRPVEDITDALPIEILPTVNNALRCSAAGSPETVRGRIAALTDLLEPDEVIVNGNIWDRAARLRSFEIAAEIFQDLNLEAA